MQETKVYIASTESLYHDGVFERLYRQASPSRQLKTSRYLRQESRCASLAAECLLRYAAQDVGLSGIEVVQSEIGKPCFLHSDISFNLSHSGMRVMCVIGPGAVGCDVQQERDVNLNLAGRFFAEDEQHAIEKAHDDEKKELFFRYWTLKESFAKTVGLGLAIPFNRFCMHFSDNGITVHQQLNKETYHFREYYIETGYHYAVCSTSRPADDVIQVDLTKGL